jgi:hypothetical protein
MNPQTRRAIDRAVMIQQAQRTRRGAQLSWEVQSAKLRQSCVIPVESCREKPGINGKPAAEPRPMDA